MSEETRLTSWGPAEAPRAGKDWGQTVLLAPEAAGAAPPAGLRRPPWFSAWLLGASLALSYQCYQRLRPPNALLSLRVEAMSLDERGELLAGSQISLQKGAAPAQVLGPAGLKLGGFRGSEAQEFELRHQCPQGFFATQTTRRLKLMAIASGLSQKLELRCQAQRTLCNLELSVSPGEARFGLDGHVLGQTVGGRLRVSLELDAGSRHSLQLLELGSGARVQGKSADSASLMLPRSFSVGREACLVSESYVLSPEPPLPRRSQPSSVQRPTRL